ncbi:MAG: hypothetical protein ACE5IR_28415 [bacterium]
MFGIRGWRSNVSLHAGGRFRWGKDWSACGPVMTQLRFGKSAPRESYRGDLQVAPIVLETSTPN